MVPAQSIPWYLCRQHNTRSRYQAARRGAPLSPSRRGRAGVEVRPFDIAVGLQGSWPTRGPECSIQGRLHRTPPIGCQVGPASTETDTSSCLCLEFGPHELVANQRTDTTGRPPSSTRSSSSIDVRGAARCGTSRQGATAGRDAYLAL